MVALVLESMRKDGKAKPSPKGPDEGQGEGETAAAEEVLAAVHSDEPEALAAALRSFVRMCVDGYEGE